MTDSATSTERILVIKLGALGDVVLALGPMAAIRRHHASAHITVLTTKPYAPLLQTSGLFDEIWIDERPRWTDIGAWLRLRRQLRDGRFTRVYDLQTSDRSSGYFRLFPRAAKPEWSGIARGCSHPHDNPARDDMHTVERQREQLLAAGIDQIDLPDLSWADADVSRFELSKPFVLMAPGGSAHRPEKRWPAERYAVLANTLTNKGLQPVLLGTKAEAEDISTILELAPKARSLMGETAILEIAALARQAAAAVGNDSGPMHLIACAGAPSVVLFSHVSDPALCAPRGQRVRIIRRDPLAALSPAEVAAAIDETRNAAT